MNATMSKKFTASSLNRDATMKKSDITYSKVYYCHATGDKCVDIHLWGILFGNFNMAIDAEPGYAEWTLRTDEFDCPDDGYTTLKEAKDTLFEMVSNVLAYEHETRVTF